jgi:hypothetical protein
MLVSIYVVDSCINMSQLFWNNFKKHQQLTMWTILFFCYFKTSPWISNR